MNRAGMFVLVLALSGCSLLLDAGDHTGGTPGEDGGRTDASVADASVADAGDADIDEPDAGPPPPECASDVACGAPGVAACIDQRCVFCAAFSAVTPIASSAMYDGRLSLAIGESGASSEIGLAWTGSGSAVYVHRTPVVAPSGAPGTLPSRSDQLLAQLNTNATMDVVGLEIGAAPYEMGERYFELAAVVHDASQSSHNYALWSPTGFTSNTFPNSAEFTDPVRDLVPLILKREGGGAIGRRTDGLGNVLLVSYETAYGNERESFVRTDLPAEAVEAASAGRLVGMPTATGLLLWDGVMDNTPAEVLTTDRTGRAALGDAGADSYFIAYPAGAQLRVRLLRCGGAPITSCLFDDAFTVDLDTGADSVDRVSVVVSNGRPVLLSAERGRDGSSQLVMRVLRPNGLPYDAPGGGSALVLDTVAAGSTFHDARLALAPDGALGRYVAAWISGTEAAGARDVRVRSIPVACDL